MKQEFEVIAIYWEKVSLEHSLEYSKTYDKGLYQIYGKHFVYGADCLLYIGETTTTFSDRLLNDKRIHSGDLNESTIYPLYARIGRIVNLKKSKTYDLDQWNKIILTAEELLISVHTPAINSKLSYSLYSIQEKYANKHFIIYNLGDIGSLLPEISSLRYTYNFYEKNNPIGMN